MSKSHDYNNGLIIQISKRVEVIVFTSNFVRLYSLPCVEFVCSYVCDDRLMW